VVKFQYTPIILEASVANRLSRNGGHVIEALDHVVAKEVEVLVRLRQPKDLVQTFEDRFLAQNLHKLVRGWLCSLVVVWVVMVTLVLL
jgi:hypothetical protein